METVLVWTFFCVWARTSWKIGPSGRTSNALRKQAALNSIVTRLLVEERNDKNQCWFRYSSDSRSLKFSTKPFCVGLLGLLSGNDNRLIPFAETMARTLPEHVSDHTNP